MSKLIFNYCCFFLVLVSGPIVRYQDFSLQYLSKESSLLLSREDVTHDEKRDFSGKAHQELDRIKRLIRQLLDFATPRRLAAESISVNTLIRHTIAFVSLEKTFAGCAIATELSAERDGIIADEDALQQVLINLLLNAIDATAAHGEKERRITVATEVANSSRHGQVIVIRIKDNGVGIDQEHLQKVFDPFFSPEHCLFFPLFFSGINFFTGYLSV